MRHALESGGQIVAEVDSPSVREVLRQRVRWETDTVAGQWFAWARVGAAAVDQLAHRAGLHVLTVDEAAGRYFARMTHSDPQRAGVDAEGSHRRGRARHAENVTSPIGHGRRNPVGLDHEQRRHPEWKCRCCARSWPAETQSVSDRSYEAAYLTVNHLAFAVRYLVRSRAIDLVQRMLANRQVSAGNSHRPVWPL